MTNGETFAATETDHTTLEGCGGSHTVRKGVDIEYTPFLRVWLPSL
jgi:hypothetical protein